MFGNSNAWQCPTPKRTVGTECLLVFSTGNGVEMEKKLHTYCETLNELIEARPFSREVRAMLRMIDNPDVARGLLVADEEEGLLDPHSDYCNWLTQSVRGFLSVGLMRQGPDGLQFSETFRAATGMVLSLSRLREVSNADNLNGKLLIEDLVRNDGLAGSIVMLSMFLGNE